MAKVLQIWLLVITIGVSESMLNVLKQMPTLANLFRVCGSFHFSCQQDSLEENSACGFTNHFEHPHYYIHNSEIVFCSKLYPVAESTLSS